MKTCKCKGMLIKKVSYNIMDDNSDSYDSKESTNYSTLVLECTSCLKTYKSDEHDNIISLDVFDDEPVTEGEDDEIIDPELIIEDPTIEKKRHFCNICKKETITKYWREDESLKSRYLCIECETLY